MLQSQFGACLIALAAGTAGADVVSLGAARDNTLFEDVNGALSNGAGEYLFAGITAIETRRRGLIAFDVAAVPAGSVVTSVSLTLHMSRTASGGEAIFLHRALAAWGEGTSDAPLEEGTGTSSTANDATWLHTFYPGLLWTTPGGDFASAESAVKTVQGQGFYTWSGDGLVADVQSWVNNPGSNLGWVILGNESVPFTAKRFDSREHRDPAVRPVLTIEYTAVPSPGLAIWGLVAGALSFPRGRR
jgi:hypothetical protein